MALLNDVHSQLNLTAVAELHRPGTLEEIVNLVRRARAEGLRISVSGGRHAMGGQQFATGALHLDMSGLDRVLDRDPVRGHLHIEAGAEWPAIIGASHQMEFAPGKCWSIRQKQTGVDSVSLGGSIAANIHGRGLLMQPLGNDIEDLTLVNAEGECIVCSRERNPELFSLVIGGYGLFGIIYSATLRLAPRQRVRRIVDIIDLDDAMNAVFRRAGEGCLYGDFQFAINPHDPGFLRRGVFACYMPSADEEGESTEAADLGPDAWLKLLKLAHEDKQAAFRLYARHYLQTDGNHYWSDTMQLSTYIPSYAEFLDAARPVEDGKIKETLVIGEHYVPPDQLLEFMRQAKKVFLKFGTEVIYGTIRAIQRDTVSYLPWARENFACVIFNLRTPHDAAGMENTRATFLALVEISRDLGGSFFLTYHRHASVEQVVSCYPRFGQWLALKTRYDPDGLFSSDWYSHYRHAFAAG